VLWCIVFYSILFYSIVLYCIVLYCIVLHCVVLYCIVLCCIGLHCIALYCIVLHWIALHCIALHCIAFYFCLSLPVHLLGDEHCRAVFQATGVPHTLFPADEDRARELAETICAKIDTLISIEVRTFSLSLLLVCFSRLHV
jgi:hypothetical protein